MLCNSKFPKLPGAHECITTGHIRFRSLEIEEIAAEIVCFVKITSVRGNTLGSWWGDPELGTIGRGG